MIYKCKKGTYYVGEGNILIRLEENHFKILEGRKKGMMVSYSDVNKHLERI